MTIKGAATGPARVASRVHENRKDGRYHRSVAAEPPRNPEDDPAQAGDKEELDS